MVKHHFNKRIINWGKPERVPHLSEVKIICQSIIGASLGVQLCTIKYDRQAIQVYYVSLVLCSSECDQ